MRQIDLNDLSFAAKMKSDLMFLLWNLEKEKDPAGQEFINDLRLIVREFIEFENNLQDSFMP